MISTLEDAREWYESVRAVARDMERLGRLFWDRDDWAADLARDNRFREVASSEIALRSGRILTELDDLGVLVLFSVFEAIVRDRARADVERSLAPPLHPAVDRAVADLLAEIDSGSFGRVTRAFQGMDPDLIEQVNQVRRYRNWVAHGRRGAQPPYVDPRMAFERLRRFLDRMAEVAGGEDA